VLLVGGFLGFFLGAVVGGGLMLVRRAGRKSKIPFGPFMLLGTLIGVLWGQQLWDAYVSAMGL
jgi:leader peptidase (prepilin peptidase)/N-methyltransferase